MNELPTRDIKEELMEKSFEYFSQNGLENTSLRDLCKGIGVSSGSMYYWFDNKEDIIITTAKYALEKSISDIFNVAVDGMMDFEGFFEKVFIAIEKYMPKLRFIYQVATSPYYGERLRKKSRQLYEGYEIYAHKLAETADVSVDVMRPVVYMFMSILLHYIIWNDSDIAMMQGKELYKYMCAQIENAHGKK